MIGPPLPPGFVREDDEEISSSTILQENHQKDSSSSSSTESIQGNQNSKRFYGPSKEALQESKRIKLTEEEEDSEDDTIGFVGPPLPSAFQSQLSEQRQARLEEHNKELEKIEKANEERKVIYFRFAISLLDTYLKPNRRSQSERNGCFLFRRAEANLPLWGQGLSVRVVQFISWTKAGQKFLQRNLLKQIKKVGSH